MTEASGTVTATTVNVPMREPPSMLPDERPECPYCGRGSEPNSNGYHAFGNGFVACVEMCQGGAHVWVKKGVAMRTDYGTGTEWDGWLECEKCGESKPLED